MNDVELEQRLRRTYRAVAERTVVTRHDEASPLAFDLGREAGDGHALGDPPDLVDLPVPLDAADPADLPVPAGLQPAGRQARLARRGWRATAIATAAALVVLVAGVAIARLGGGHRRDAETADVGQGLGVGHWEELPPAPIDAYGAGQVWTGTEVIVFGGYTDGPATPVAAYDPAGRSWRQLADLPEEMSGATMGVWTGDELVAFADERPGVAAVYDPGTDGWTVLAGSAIPSLHVESYAVWTGDKVLVAGFQPSGSDTNDLGSGAVLYDPASDQWQTLPEAPRPLAANSDAVWTGREMVFVTSAPSVDGLTALDGLIVMALDPAAGTWRVLPAPPLPLRETPLLVWTGSELVVAGGTDWSLPVEEDPDGVGARDAVVFDPATDTWAPYPAPPVAVWGNDIAAMPVVAAVGGQIVSFSTEDPDRRPVILDPVTRTWHLGAPPPDSLPEQSNRTAISIGDQVLVQTLTSPSNEGAQDQATFSYTLPT